MSDAAAPPLAIVFLHHLGGSRRSWDRVVGCIGAGARCIAVDLPGFGANGAASGHSVAEMARAVCRTVRDAAAPAWVLVGHSMGAKVAAVVARWAEDGEAGLAGLRRVVLVAGSPPSPEPMEEGQRAAMLGWFGGDAAANRADAHAYLAQNTSQPLSGPDRAQAVEDVLGAHPAAWRAWLERGSREDWAARVGVLQTPALVIAGEEDGPLGPDAQRRDTVPHYAHARLVTLPGAKHLLPFERPDELARLILGGAA